MFIGSINIPTNLQKYKNMFLYGSLSDELVSVPKYIYTQSLHK